MRVMLISSISGSNHVAPLPLGLNLVAVATREAGHDVRMITLPESGDITAMIREAVRESRPDVIGVSARNVDDQNRE
ncbi:MAG: B12-binding domain-containing radical SAM protein, partial [Geobacteraceae bacterium]|nr:B12-binding domain-containing radical SAM protein [Geobacteraceae bacterium]